MAELATDNGLSLAFEELLRDKGDTIAKLAWLISVPSRNGEVARPIDLRLVSAANKLSLVPRLARPTPEN